MYFLDIRLIYYAHETFMNLNEYTDKTKIMNIWLGNVAHID